MRGYAHLVQQEPYHIDVMRREGDSIRRIAEGIKRSPSAVSGELRRNAGQLHRFLRHSHRKRRKRYGKHDFRGRIPCCVDISERPAVVEEHSRLGDWEADTVIAKWHRGALVTVVERSTRFVLAHPIRRRTKEEAMDALLRMVWPLSEWMHTVAYDNRRESSGHMHVATGLDCDDYFARPYSSCDRGANENGNGLLRQWFPKAMPLHEVTPEQVQDAVDRFNDRPRKCLGYQKGCCTYGLNSDKFNRLLITRKYSYSSRTKP